MPSTQARGRLCAHNKAEARTSITGTAAPYNKRCDATKCVETDHLGTAMDAAARDNEELVPRRYDVSAAALINPEAGAAVLVPDAGI